MLALMFFNSLSDLEIEFEIYDAIIEEVLTNPTTYYNSRDIKEIEKIVNQKISEMINQILDNLPQDGGVLIKSDPEFDFHLANFISFLEIDCKVIAQELEEIFQEREEELYEHK